MYRICYSKYTIQVPESAPNTYLLAAAVTGAFFMAHQADITKLANLFWIIMVMVSRMQVAFTNFFGHFLLELNVFRRPRIVPNC